MREKGVTDEAVVQLATRLPRFSTSAGQGLVRPERSDHAGLRAEALREKLGRASKPKK